MKIKLSIIIPCYNEEERIGRTLEEIANYIKTKKYDFEVIIVDDGSKDKTLEVAGKFKDKLDLKILKNPGNKGKGYSVKAGMLASLGDYSLFMDADSSTSIRELDSFFPWIDKYDILIGSRHLRKHSILIKQSAIRRTAGFFAHKLIKLFIISDVKDTMCGFKIFNKKAKILFKKQLNYRWGFDFELLFLAEKLGFRIKEIPVTWKDDRKSKVTLKGYFIALLELLRIRWNYLLGRYR